MCGIFGAISDRHVEAEKMMEALKHRGPDFQSIFKESRLTIGHTRLSIIDLSSTANQPMSSYSGQTIIVYNGEVYNFKSIRIELRAIGVNFKTQSDTEVLLEGFEIWGNKLFDKLNGMFAISIYDRRDNSLTLVRDRFGIKPLYYAIGETELVFGSEIKALLASGLIDSNMSFQGLHEYLHFSTTLGETTFYEEIHKLLPGHYLRYNLLTNKFQIKPFKLNYDLAVINDSKNDVIENVRVLFEESVKRQLVADVPVGIFLSGGIDSTAITAIASKNYSGQLKTFSSGFDFDKGVNELPKARSVAEKFGTDHTEFHIKGSDIPDILEELNGFFDQPFSDAANIPLYLMGKELKGKHKVILQGDGGDELFAGYNQYYRVKNERLFKSISKVSIFGDFMIPKSSKYYRMMRSMYAVAQKDKSLVTARLYSQEMLKESPSGLFNQEWQARIDSVDPFMRHRELHNLFKHFDLLQELLYTDMNTMLPDQYLEKVDRSTMANSLEIRVPFLDNDLASYVMSLPSNKKIYGKEKKYILKKAFEGIVPKDILYGPKRGFGVPFQHWLKSSMKEYMFDTINSSNVYDPQVEKMMQDHVSGRRDHGYILWKLLNLSIWLNKNKN